MNKHYAKQLISQNSLEFLYHWNDKPPSLSAISPTTSLEIFHQQANTNETIPCSSYPSQTETKGNDEYLSL